MLQPITSAEERWRDRLLGPALERVIPAWVHPNALTALRLVLVPVAILMELCSVEAPAQVAVLSAAALTDGMDGTLARRRNQVTALGRVLDHGADALLGLWVAVLALQHRLLVPGMVLAMALPEICHVVLALAFALVRPLGVTDNFARFFLRSYSATRPHPTTVGRLQMVTLLVGLFALVLAWAFGSPLLRGLGTAFVYAEITCSYVSAALGLWALIGLVGRQDRDLTA